MTILITGGSGFIGTNVIRELRHARPDITIYNYGKHPSVIEGVRNIEGDATDFDPDLLPDGIDYVLHLLALANNKYCLDLSYAEAVNIGFTRKMLEWAKTQKQLKKFMYMSSILLYDQSTRSPVPEDAPIYLHHNNYSFTKGIGEAYVEHYRQEYGLPCLVFRLSNIYGPYQRPIESPFLVPSKIVQALTEGRIEVQSGKPKRDWIYSEDAAAAIVRMLDAPYQGVLNLASGTGASVDELMHRISSQLGVPYSSLDKEMTGPNDFYCDISKITSLIDWHPSTSLDQGMAQTIDYIRNVLKLS